MDYVANYPLACHASSLKGDVTIETWVILISFSVYRTAIVL